MDGTINIYTDGGARGNPGPAAAAFVAIRDGKVVFKNSRFLGVSTNNIAEYQAVVLALSWLLENRKMYQEEIFFYLDSELVVRQLTGIYKIKNKKLKLLVQEVENITRKIKGKISYIQIRRERNKLADKLVNLKIDG